MSTLQRLLAPRGIAVVGASQSPGKLGHAMMTSLATYGGVLAPVNPSGADGMYVDVAAAAAAHPDELDLALLCIPAGAVPAALRECAAAGLGAAVVCAGGFGEIGEAGAEVQAAVEAAVAETGIRLLGPNTSGFFSPGAKVYASFVPGVASLGAGAVGVVAASGGVNHALAFSLQATGAGVSTGVGIGAGVDVTTAEVLDHLAEDPATRSIALHLETVPDGPRLLDAVRRAVAIKPVVALVVGRNDIGEFAQSHTGALATSWAVTRSLLRQVGAVVVENEVELVTAASALSGRRMRPSAEPGVALVTGQAGPGLLIADELGTRGVKLPALAASTRERVAALLPPLTYLDNPVDTGRPGTTYPEILAAVGADEQVDLLTVYGITEPVVTLPEALAAAELDVPALIAVDGPREEVDRVRALGDAGGQPVLVGPTALTQGIAALVADARAQVRAGSVPLSAPAPGTVAAGPWHEAAAKDLLDQVGVRTPSRRVATNLDEALAAQAELPGPLAVKLLDAAVLHKTEIGGVHLKIADPEGLRTAVAALQDIGAREFLIEAMAPAGVDLLVGLRRDPVFGPIVVLGLGGVEAEVWGDTAICGLPATEADLAELPDRLQAADLLFGFRGGPTLDRAELARVIAALAGLLEAETADGSRIDEVEINPLRLTDEGLVALDAVFSATVAAQEENR